VIGVVGVIDFDRELNEVLRVARLPEGRSLAKRPVRTAEDARSCHILYVARDQSTRLGEVLDWVRGRPVLTVSDIEAFCETGGMFRLQKLPTSMGTELNLAVLEGAGLQVSSKLARLSRLVSTREKR
jgi:hypothetical protein